MNALERPRIDWPTSVFLVLTPLAALILTPLHLVFNGVSWPLVALLVIYGALSNLSITAGYHRLMSHQSYEASLWVRLAYLFVGAGAFQGSALKWCSDHRRHHRFVDTDKDPYNIHRGFFFAHMGWLFLRDPVDLKDRFAPDLARDRWIALQHKYYVPIAILSGFGLPTFIGWALGSPLGGFIFGGALRIVITQQTTFLINSYCHYFGRQTYGGENSAKDSVVVSFFTHGEGYHNFHHHFAADYRNGVRWFDWDPTKWFIRTLSWLGLARSLRRVSPDKILQARLKAEERSLIERGLSQEMVLGLRRRLEDSQRRWMELKAEYQLLKANLRQASAARMDAMNSGLDQMRGRYDKLKRDMRLARLEFKYSRRHWRSISRVCAN